MIKSAAKSQKTLFFFENKKDIFSAISEFLFLFKIYCQRKRKIKTDKTILNYFNNIDKFTQFIESDDIEDYENIIID